MLGTLVARAATAVTRTEPPRLFVELGRHPRLFRSWLPFAGTLLFRADLPRPDTELVILRTAVNCRCDYEWVQHVKLAERAGLSEDEIVAAARVDASTCLTWRQQRLLDATDELHEVRRISTTTFGRLEHALSSRQLMELCMLVGHYEMLAMTINSLAIQPEPTAIAHLSARTAAIAEELTPSFA